MKKIAFFDAKPYDRTWFDQLNQHYHIKYYEHKLTPDTISLAHGCEAVIPQGAGFIYRREWINLSNT